MAMTPFGTDAQLFRYLSEYGIESWADHMPISGEDYAPIYYGGGSTGFRSDVLEDCKVYAMGFLVGRLAQRYEYTVLLTVPMMAEVYCIVCLREFCLRRGNPPPASLEFRYQELVQKDGTLDQIVKGIVQLVDANGNLVRTKNPRVPKHSNLQVDRRFGERRIRVTTGSSNMDPTRMRRSADINQEFDR
jgi:hypothetical protein